VAVNTGNEVITTIVTGAKGKGLSEITKSGWELSLYLLVDAWPSAQPVDAVSYTWMIDQS
jgi:hypothetical protein